MKISIITVCFNSGKTIKDTVKSVSIQHYNKVEHIVVDGGSIDATMEIVRASSSVSSYLSESDKGIYHAMNKGLKLATGDIIGFLNADDFYINNSVLTKVAKAFEDESVDACYGDLVYVKENDTNQIVRFWKSKPYKQGLFKLGWMPAHPTFFVRRSVYEKYGMFDLNYKIAADFELLFRFIEKNNIKTIYLPEVLIKMRMGGTTNKNINNIKIQNNEIIQLLKTEYQDFSMVKFWTYKIFNRLKQFIVRPKSVN